MPLLLIGLGGFAGAISRYLVDGFVTDRTAGAFPWGTLAVNLSGRSCSELDAMVGDGLITLEKVEVLAYRGGPREA